MEVIEIILITLVLFEAMECLKRIYGYRRWWVRPALRDRGDHGFFETHFPFPEEFGKTIRMEKPTFDFLLSLIREKITKQSNRPSISAECRLYLTLSYLAHGGSKPFHASSFKVGLSNMKNIVGETCEALWDVLAPIYLAAPQKDEWKRIAVDFYTMWDLPNCVGAIDGKHINIFCPSNSGSLFYNYKGNFSIVLLAVCDANYTFTGIDIGAYGSQSDGGVLWHSGYGKDLYGGKHELPENYMLPGTNTSFPHYFVGDNAFPLKPFLMKPYPGTNLAPDRLNYNKRLSRGRRVIENAFGILACRWRILLSPLQMSPTSAEKIVKATVVLHNFLKMHDGSYCPPESVDQEENGSIRRGLWRNEIPVPLQNARPACSNNASRTAFNLRDLQPDSRNRYRLSAKIRLNAKENELSKC